MRCDDFEKEGVFERYLQGELTEAEAAELENHCFICDSCFWRLQLTESIIGVVRATPREKLFSQPQPKTPRKYSFAFALAGIAAVALVGILLSPLHWSRSGKYAALVELEAPRYIPGNIRDGGGANAADPSFSAGMSLYQQGKYAQAADRLEESLRRFPDKPQATYYLGISLLISKKPKQALACFEALLDRQAEAFQDDCRWHAAMACLLLGDSLKAERHLQPLAGGASRYSRRAGELISRIHER